MSAKATEANIRRFDLGGDYLQATDLLVDGTFRTYPLTITEYHPPNTLEKAAGGKIDVPVIAFAGTSKKLCLNKTNQRALHLIAGTNNADQVVGCKVTIQVRMIRFGPDNVLGLRIIPKVGTIMPKNLIVRLGIPALWMGVAKNGKEISHENQAPQTVDGGGEEGD